MSWPEITAIIGAVSGLLAVFGGGIYLGRLNTKVDILWTLWLDTVSAKYRIKGPSNPGPSSTIILSDRMKSEAASIMSREGLRPGRDLRPQVAQIMRPKIMEYAEQNNIPLDEVLAALSDFVLQSRCR